jgi:hypothetical protein
MANDPLFVLKYFKEVPIIIRIMFTKIIDLDIEKKFFFNALQIKYKIKYIAIFCPNFKGLLSISSFVEQYLILILKSDNEVKACVLREKNLSLMKAII